MKSYFSRVVPILFVLLLQLLIVVGWILNIVKIVGAIDEPLTGMLILRIIGVFTFPLGVILGYL